MSTTTLETPVLKPAATVSTIEKTSERGSLALQGGAPAVTLPAGDLFTWPIVTAPIEAAVLEVLRRGAMSGTDVTQQFEREFAAWQGTRFALGFNNGTAAIHAAMYGCGVGFGDEIICPSITYWASAMPALSLGATIVFADIDPLSLCIDPGDIERRITPRTKAIVAVHYLGHPCEMDAIMAIARRRGIKVIEDVSHAQGGLYHGRKLGAIGDVGAMSLMSAKSFAIGEAGILVTDNREIHERAMAFGHYDRYRADSFETAELKPYAGLPLGGYKYRMHQLSAAMGREQLKVYDAQSAEIRQATNYFWDLLEGVPGLRAHRVDQSTGSNMGGWYAAHGFYRAQELGGLSMARFCAAVRAEGTVCAEGSNFPLHLHPALNECDIYGHGKPTPLARSDRDPRQPAGSLPVSERINDEIYFIPTFKKFRAAQIEEHANAYRKVARNFEALLAGDAPASRIDGSTGLSARLRR